MHATFFLLRDGRGQFPRASQIHAVGQHCILPVQDGKMVIGHAQDIYFVEFDGLKMRSYFIEVIGE